MLWSHHGSHHINAVTSQDLNEFIFIIIIMPRYRPGRLLTSRRAIKAAIRRGKAKMSRRRKRVRFSRRRIGRSRFSRRFSRGVRRFSRRYSRGGRRSRISVRRGLIASSTQNVVFKKRFAKRSPHLSKSLAKRVDNHLASKWTYNSKQVNELSQVPGAVNGEFIIQWVPPTFLASIWRYVIEQQSKTYAQGGYTLYYNAPAGAPADYLNGVAAQSLKISKLAWYKRVTNVGTSAVVVRFSEWKAKRDIPRNMSMAYTGSTLGREVHPINGIFDYLLSQAAPRAAGGQMQPDMAAPYNEDYVAYNYDSNKIQSFPVVNYYFKIKSMKEVRLEPGASTDFVYSYTPTMKMHYALYHYSSYPQANLASQTDRNLYGYAIWNGLNHKGPMIEFKGIVQGMQNEALTNYATQTIAKLITEDRVVVQTELPPFKIQGVYSASVAGNIPDPTATGIGNQQVRNNGYVINKPGAYIQGTTGSVWAHDPPMTIPMAGSDTIS